MPEDKKIPLDVKVEIKRVEDLKESVRKEFDLEGSELAFKIITHNSPYEFVYEKIQGDFLQSVTNILKNTDLNGFIKKARERG